LSSDYFGQQSTEDLVALYRRDALLSHRPDQGQQRACQVGNV